jgi:hypothetical protein
MPTTGDTPCELSLSDILLSACQYLLELNKRSLDIVR